MATISRREFIILTLQLMFISQIPGCNSYRPVLGRNSLKKPIMVEDHSQFLAHWAEKGIRDAVLVNIDTHDDLRWMPDNRIDALRQIYQQQDWQRFRTSDGHSADSLYHIGNWIYAGGRLGIFREVYWVIPFDVLSMKNPDLHIRRFLKDYEFNEQEIGAFSLNGRQFRGTFHGVPLTICDINSLPDIRSPILLSIDTDFFPPYSTVHEKSYLSSLLEVFQALYRQKYRIEDAAVCYSVNGDYLPPYLRWVGDTIGIILEKPGLLDQQPPELQLLLQQIDNDYRSTDSVQILKTVDAWHTRYPAASLQAYKALAHVLDGDHDKARQAVHESCRLDRRYCTLFPYIGTYYYSGGNYSAAEQFYQAGFAANPAMANGLFQYGHCLRQTGRMKQALEFYQKDEAVNGLFPTRFLIAEMQLLLNERQAAAASITKAVEGLTSNRYAQVVNDETARAIYAAMNFCDQEGLRELSSILRNNPTVIQMLKAYPPNSHR